MISSFTVFLQPDTCNTQTLVQRGEAPNKSHKDKTASPLRQKFHAREAFLMHLIQFNSLCDPFIYTEAGHIKLLYSDYAFHWMLWEAVIVFVSLLSVLKACA